MQDVNDSVAIQYGLATNEGVLIKAVIENSPAEAGGLLEGDVIQKIAGEEATNYELVREAILAHANEEIGIDIVRDEEPLTLEVVVGTQTAQESCLTVRTFEEEQAGGTLEEEGYPRLALAHYVEALDPINSYGVDFRLRQKVFKLVQQLGAPPAVSEEAANAYRLATEAQDNATDRSGYLEAIREYSEALLLAPWVAEAYYNIAALYEVTGYAGLAIYNYSLYLAASPDASDAEAIRQRVSLLREHLRASEAEEQQQPTANNQAPSGMTFLQTNSQGYEEYRWDKDGATMIKIPAGTFIMGSNDGGDDEKPMHQPYLSEYYIDKYEVTNRQYKQFCDATGRSYPSDPDFAGMPGYFTSEPDYPVVNVSWDDAAAFAAWTGKSLPTEAQWEKAARGTDGRKYPWGDAEPDPERCNFNSNLGKTAAVGSYPSDVSPCGCMDMAGNVTEWCNDWYNYYGSANDDPQGSPSGSYRVNRGGSWYGGAAWSRCAIRSGSVPASRNLSIGFRCARSE
jgi:formylglycine-generating enzyme required for sulfatase activity